MTVAGDLVGIHSTDPRTVFLSLWARMRAVDVGTIERALYEDRTLVRMLGMRRTLFVVPRDLVPVLHAVCTLAIAKRERRRIIQVLDQAGVAKDPSRWLRQAERVAVDALAGRGDAVGAELVKADSRLARRILMAPGTRFEGEVSVASRVLTLLSMEGRIV